MKTANKTATAAAAFMMAAAAQAENYTAPKATEVTVTRDSEAIALTFVHHACTSDKHLVSETDTAILPITETEENPVTAEEMKALADLYQSVSAPLAEELLGILAGSFTAKEMEHMQSTELDSMPEGLLTEERLLPLMAKLIELAPDVMASTLKFREGMLEILEGNIGLVANKTGEPKTIISPAPSPLCK